MTRIGQGIAAGVAQHVSMDPKRQLGALANGFHEAVDGVRREGNTEVSRCGVSAIGMEPGLALTARLGEVPVLNQQKFVSPIS